LTSSLKTGKFFYLSKPNNKEYSEWGIPGNLTELMDDERVTVPTFLFLIANLIFGKFIHYKIKTEEGNMMILLFGFGPFGKWKKNPAGVIAKEFDGEEYLGEKIKGLEIPVSARYIRNEIPKLIKENKPKIVLGIGLATVPVVYVERVAINLMDFSKPDVDGYKAEDEPIFEDGPTAYFTNLDVKKVIKNLRKSGIPSTISYSAGTYLCNALFYAIMHTINKEKINSIGGFIHIPPFPEMVVDKNIASMSKELSRKAIHIIIETAIKG